ncbi:lipopolysaccharide biosynthesis protein [Nitrosomonas sp.]|uniref:lipopolysaccharide biosynthesis protein n=1 Tax=Nitrosomonas sp. TaxID=42353 RepID=UPI00207FB738|nr:hypothetical protein [Nitrosomonas sp.]GJL74301.1 MAG: hypothetical protein NMNS02_04070 [Nitrosomonas sp.]
MYSGSELKYSAVHFLTGKFVSALLTLIILLWLVRLLTTEEYGVYMILIAGMELTLAIVSCGLPWLSARYLPEFRLHGSGHLLIRFVWKIIALLGFTLIAGVFLLFLSMQWLLPMELMQYANMAILFLVVVLLEGLSRRIRENILGPLMQQKQAQISLAARNFVFLLLIGVIVFQQTDIYLYHVVMAEIIASALGFLLVLYGLIGHLKAYRNTPGQAGWKQPSSSGMWRVALNMYASNLITLTYSPQAFVFLTQRYLGIEATALFGFLCKLYSQLASYLPATLLFSLIQPKLVASYVNAKNMSELVRNAKLAGKLSLFVLMPAVAYVWLVGDELLSLISGGKFTQSGYYLTGLMFALIPLSQHRILTTIAVAIDKNHIVMWSGLLGVLSLPLAYGLLEAGQGLWGPIAAMIISQALFNASIISFLVRNTTYRPDTVGFAKLIMAAISGFFLAQLPIIQIQGWASLLIMVLLVPGFFLLAAYYIKPFKADERERLNSFINRKIFVW